MTKEEFDKIVNENLKSGVCVFSIEELVETLIIALPTLVDVVEKNLDTLDDIEVKGLLSVAAIMKSATVKLAKDNNLDMSKKVTDTAIGLTMKMSNKQN